MKVDNLIYLSLVFPSIEQLYLDASYFYFPRMEEWHLMVGHDEPFANQEKEGWYRQERINLLRELVMALENFTNLN